MSPSENCEGLRTSRASRIIPAHVPKMGLPAAWNFSSAGTKSHVSSSLSKVVLSPPGMTSPPTCSSCPGMRTSSEGTPIRSSAAACWAKSPCSASTPMVMVISTSPSGRPLPAARLQQVRFLELGGLDARHRLAELLGDAREHVGILVVRGGLHDGAGPRGRIRGLEDPGADEHRLGAELHHESGVGGSGDAARREVRHRQVPALAHP